MYRPSKKDPYHHFTWFKESKENKLLKSQKRSESMTIVIGIVCKDGILVQADTKFVNTEGMISIQDSKIFTINFQQKPLFVVGFSGQKDVFKHASEIVMDNFDRYEDKKNLLTERECEQLLRECRDDLYRRLNIERFEKRKIEPSKQDEVVLNCLFAGYVKVNDKLEPRIYNFSPYTDPDHQKYQVTGAGDLQMLFLFNSGRHVLRRLGKSWDSLSAKLVSQILSFPFRYIPEINPTIGYENNSKLITIEKGVIDYGTKMFFPETFESEEKGKRKDYVPEFINTIFDELPKEKLKELLLLSFNGSRFNILKTFFSFLK